MTRALLLILLLAATSVTLGVMAEDAEEDYVNDNDYDTDPGDEDEEETYTGPPPVIRSLARDLSVKPGETARFPCEVEHSSDAVALMWLKDKQLLWTDKFRSVEDKRFEKLSDNTLQIRNVKSSDAGHYICRLATQDKMEVSHNLNILLTPRIEKLLPGATKVIHKDNPLTLECKVTGYPAPTVTWTRKGKNLPSGEEAVEGHAITFEAVTRKHAGVYECMASNGVGEPATATVDVQVQYSPEIEIEREIVNSEEGYDAELVCEVHAEPKGKVGWFRDGQPLPIKGQDHMNVIRQGSRHILQIRKTTKADFGSYTCHANNSLGRIDRVIKLSGEPSPAKFVAGSEMEGGQMMEWLVESHSPVTKYELRYKTKQMSEWKTIHPVVENPEGNVYTVKQELSGLSSGQYEVVLRAENLYGWSEPSIPHMFELIEKRIRVAVAGTNGIAEPSMGEATAAAAAQSPLLALLTILSLSSFFL